MQNITWVVDAGLDAMTKGNPQLSLFILELVVELWAHIFRKEGIVLRQIGTLGRHVAA